MGELDFAGPEDPKADGQGRRARELLVRSYYQFNTASCSKLRSEVWSGNLKYCAGRLHGNRLCRTFSFSAGLSDFHAGPAASVAYSAPLFGKSGRDGKPGRVCHANPKQPQQPDRHAWMTMFTVLKLDNLWHKRMWLCVVSSTKKLPTCLWPTTHIISLASRINENSTVGKSTVFPGSI